MFSSNAIQEGVTHSFTFKRTMNACGPPLAFTGMHFPAYTKEIVIGPLVIFVPLFDAALLVMSQRSHKMASQK